MSISMLSYNGILTKVRAMESHLMTEEDYKKIASLESTTDFVNYVRNNPSYAPLFNNYDEQTLHRGQIEHILTNSIYLEFAKIYRFANQSQRKALSIIFFRYEVNILKCCLQNVFSEDNTHDLLAFEDFFLIHSELKVKELASAPTIEAFINLLNGTEYYPLFSKLYATSHNTLQDFEIQLDIYYFKKVWKQKDRLLSGKNLKAATLLYGVQIDLLNLLWIYRSKKFFDIESGKILANIIPINYKLSKEQIGRLVEAVSIEEFMKIVDTTYYAKVYGTIEFDTLEDVYLRVLSKLYKVCSEKYRTSMAPILTFLYAKSMELDYLTTALECIRYQLDPSEILSYILH